MSERYTSRKLRGTPPIKSDYVQDTIGALVRRNARRYPDEEAFVFGDRSVTFAELDELSNRFANGLREQGVEQGDRVAVIARNSFKYLLTWFGTAKTGAVHVPIHGELEPREYDFFVDKIGPSLLFVEEEPLEQIGERIAEWEVPYVPFNPYPEEETDPSVFSDIEPAVGFYDLIETAAGSDPEVAIDRDDVVQIMFTSGTTSTPKGVMHSHSNFISQYFTCISEIPIQKDDRLLAAMPMYHVAQLHNVTMPGLYLGTSQVILRDSDPEVLLKNLESEEITLMYLYASLYRRMAEHDDFSEYDLHSFRRAIYAPEMDVEEMQECYDVAFVKLFGQTEMASVTSVLHPGEHPDKIGSVGRPAGNVEVALMDDRGELLDTGDIGEIVYRGGQVMDGYYRDDERTEEAFENDWFHSGDLGRFDGDGFLWFVDRKKDIIKTGGENVPSVEVENLLRRYPDIAEAAVVGLPHDYWAEAVTGFVIRRTDDITEDELIQYCKEELAGYKVPKSIVFIESFPESASGKTQKHLLREEYSNHYK